MVEKYLQSMYENALRALKNSYTPFSKFPVGACLVTVEDRLFAGSNWENSAFPLSNCAEASAISTMISAGYREIRSIVIIAEQMEICLPCGGCLQRLAEFATDNMTTYCLSLEGKLKKSFALQQLLPHNFKLYQI